MPNPAIVAVDDDPAVLNAVERDLHSEFGRRFRVLQARSGLAGLELLTKLKLRSDPVALLLVDERMPGMDGISFLEQAMPLYPTSKRVLLTAYADTDAAIKAINRVRLDHYLLKPWDPPQEKLYPVVQDLLDDWQAEFRPAFQGVRLIGNRWSPRSHDLRDFLGRNQIPYQWLDFELSDEAHKLVEYAGESSSSLPLVLYEDGTHSVSPSISALAERIGLRTRATLPFYDFIVIGGGPTGLAAAVYGASEGLNTVMIESSAPGGQAGTSSRIENYLGFPSGVSGAQLAQRAVTQARRFGVEILAPQSATAIRHEGPYRYVRLADGSELSCHALLLAMGVSYRKLEVPGVEELTGAGIYYGAAMSEAFNCVDEDVYIVGGANSAGQAAMFFSKTARSVTLIVRGDSLSRGMSQYLVDELKERPNISVRLNSQVTQAAGRESLETITIGDSASGATETVSTVALFIFIGALPCTDWLGDAVVRDGSGFIVTGRDVLKDGGAAAWTAGRDPYLLETSVPGIFAAGDVRLNSVKRVASGVGEGLIAVQFIHQYLSNV